jgi:hypothetical protein
MTKENLSLAEVGDSEVNALNMLTNSEYQGDHLTDGPLALSSPSAL